MSNDNKQTKISTTESVSGEDKLSNSDIIQIIGIGLAAFFVGVVLAASLEFGSKLASAKHQQEIGKLESKLDEQKALIDEFESQKQQIERSFNDELLGVKAKHEEEKQDIIEDYEKRLSAMVAVDPTEQKAAATCQTENGRLESQVKSLKGTLNQKDQRINGLINDYNNLGKYCQGLERERDALKSDNIDLNNKVKYVVDIPNTPPQLSQTSSIITNTSINFTQINSRVAFRNTHSVNFLVINGVDHRVDVGSRIRKTFGNKNCVFSVIAIRNEIYAKDYAADVLLECW